MRNKSKVSLKKHDIPHFCLAMAWPEPSPSRGVAVAWPCIGHGVATAWRRAWQKLNSIQSWWPTSGNLFKQQYNISSRHGFNSPFRHHLAPTCNCRVVRETEDFLELPSHLFATTARFHWHPRTLPHSSLQSQSELTEIGIDASNRPKVKHTNKHKYTHVMHSCT